MAPQQDVKTANKKAYKLSKIHSAVHQEQVAAPFKFMKSEFFI